MNRRRVAVALLPVLMAAACKMGDSSPPTITNAPGFHGQTVTPQGQASCSIDARGQNSKGQWYLHYGCTNGSTGAYVLANKNDLPKCIVGTFWDVCAKVK